MKLTLSEDGYLAKRRQYYADKRQSILTKRAARQALRREHFTMEARKWQKSHPDTVQTTKKKYRTKNIEKVIAYTRLYHSTHKNERNAHIRKRKSIDPIFKLRESLRSSFSNRIRRFINDQLSADIRRRHSIIKLVGCTPLQLMQYLEARFKPGMSWINWGRGKDKWHIDHIRPVASFDLTADDDLRVCWHYTNLQPLWEIDNLQKSDKWGSDMHRKRRRTSGSRVPATRCRVP